MATINFTNGQELSVPLTIEEIQKLPVGHKDFIEINKEKIVCVGNNQNTKKITKKLLININSIAYIEENL
jgi:ureidoglycolate hydrolase